MKLSHLGLSAFHACALTLNVTQAALRLGITQSALSQRLSSLEAELEVTLFVRDPKGLILTEDGERLLRFTQVTKGLEDELLEDLKGSDSKLGGTVRVAAYSSILRSLIIPALTPFLRSESQVQADFRSYEIDELPGVLTSIRADFIVLDYEMNKPGVAQENLGEEEFVMVESSRLETPKDIYLDHGPLDTTTMDFFKFQGKVPKFNRSFMGDIYGIIDGVEAGLGRAVVSKHLIESNKGIKVIRGFKPYKRPITLHYFERPYYPALLKRVRAELLKA